MAAAPLPSAATPMASGRSCPRGVSPLAVTTPESIGYSKLSEWAMICWPSRETTKAANRWAADWCVVDPRAPIPATSRPQPVPVVLVDDPDGDLSRVHLRRDRLAVGVDVVTRIGLQRVEPPERRGL